MELNHSYLTLAQELIKEDSENGPIKLGMSNNIADVIRNLSPEQTRQLATSSHLLLTFKSNVHALLSVLADKAPGRVEKSRKEDHEQHHEQTRLSKA